MRVINSANYVLNGKLQYIFSLYINDDTNSDDLIIQDGTELIIYNGTVLQAAGGTGVPSAQDVYFYTIYDT